MARGIRHIGRVVRISLPWREGSIKAQRANGEKPQGHQIKPRAHTQIKPAKREIRLQPGIRYPDPAGFWPESLKSVAGAGVEQRVQPLAWMLFLARFFVLLSDGCRGTAGTVWYDGRFHKQSKP